MAVKRDWTRFFAGHHRELARVSVLVGCKVLELTIAIAEHLSRTRNLIRIYSNAAAFDATASWLHGCLVTRPLFAKAQPMRAHRPKAQQ